jgi:cytochrome bd-type quinol oxidase subunit 1
MSSPTKTLQNVLANLRIFCHIQQVNSRDYMHYPIWHIPSAGGAMLIAVISIIHVIIAHFAVGAGIFNAITEWRARRQNDPVLLQFVKDNSIFLIYLSFVGGAVTGVGIWFSIGVVAPEATSYLIRLFLWIWAIEWVFFLVELASGYVYYYTWNRVSARLHVAIGIIYAIAAFMSLVMINGILTFMLTSGDWQKTGLLFDAWMNPSFWPSLWMRTVSALALAGIFVAIVASVRKKHSSQVDRETVIAWGARFLLPLGLMPVLAFWYFSTVPAQARDLALGGAIAMTFIFIFGALLSVMVAFYAYFGLLRKARDINLETAVLMAMIAMLATGSMEFVREGIRKPYVLNEIMYSNGILVSEVPQLNQDGVLKHSAWIQPDTVHFRGETAIGEAVYRAECLRCHEIDGYNAIKPLIRHWNRPLMLSALEELDRIKAFMPPFVGTNEEKQALAAYLLTVNGMIRLPDTTAISVDKVTVVGAAEKTP